MTRIDSTDISDRLSVVGIFIMNDEMDLVKHDAMLIIVGVRQAVAVM